MDLSDEDVQQFAEEDRREVDPPIQVETASWSPGWQLDWWVKDRQEWWPLTREMPSQRPLTSANRVQPTGWILMADLR